MQKFIKKIKLHHLIFFFFYLLVFLLLLKNSFSYLDPDFGWHLKVGREIYQEKKVPHLNHYNHVFAEEDNHWVDHEWFSNYLIFLAQDNYGYVFLNIFFALLIILTLIIANSFIVKNIAPQKNFLYFLLILELLGLKACFPHFGVRVQEISLLFLLLLLIILFLFEKRTLAEKNKPWKTLIPLIPLIYLWANLHGSWLIGIFILFSYLVIKTVENLIINSQGFLYQKLKLFFNFPPPLKKKSLLSFLLFSCLSLLVTFFTPYGLRLFNFLWEYKNTAYLKIISEWLPQYYFPFIYEQLSYLGIVIAIILIAIIGRKRGNYKILSPWGFFLSLLFISLAIKSKRHFPLLFIATLPLVSDFIYQDFYKDFSAPKTKSKALAFIDFLSKTFIILCLLAALLAISIKINPKKDPFSDFCQEYPCAAITFLKENPQYLNDNIFNSYGWGGFLIHEYSEKKLFIDGRLPQKQLGGHTYIEEYKEFFSLEGEDLEKKIETYNLRLFLLEKEKPFKFRFLDKKIFKTKDKLEDKTEDKNNLLKHLEEDPSYEKIYEDHNSFIFRKN